MFGVAIGSETKAVPTGSSQKIAEGCDMAQVFCKSCSAMVGQCCRSAAYEHQDFLLDRQFYKLSRVYLKDAQSGRKIQPDFIDEYKSAPERPRSVRPSIAPKERLSATFDGASASLPPPRKQYEVLQPQRVEVNHKPRNHLQRASLPPQTPPSRTTQGDQRAYYPPPSSAFARSPSSSGLQASHKAIELTEHSQTRDNLDKLVDVEARITGESERTTILEYRMASCEHKAIELEASYEQLLTSRPGCESHIADLKRDHKHHDGLLTKQRQTIEQQQQLLISLTEKLDSLQQNMKQLEDSLEKSHQNAPVQNPEPVQDVTEVENDQEESKIAQAEVYMLRKENEALKLRLAQQEQHSQIVDGVHHATHDEVALEPVIIDVLGKRKRNVEQETQSRKFSRTSPETQLLTPESTQMTHDHDTECSLLGNNIEDEPDESPQDHEVVQVAGQSTGDECNATPASNKGVEDASSSDRQDIDDQNLSIASTSEPVVVQGACPLVVDIDASSLSIAMHLTEHVTGLRPSDSSAPVESLANTDTQSTPAKAVSSEQTNHPHSSTDLHKTSHASSVNEPSLQRPLGRFSSPVPGSFLSRGTSPAVGNTFSDALSRGQRLEDTINRHRTSRIGSNLIGAYNSANPPSNEPLRLRNDGTLVSRTIEGLTFEPLRRPVITGVPQFRKSTGSAALNVLPGFDAAIANLDKSAARHLSSALPAANQTKADSGGKRKQQAQRKEVLQPKSQQQKRRGRPAARKSRENVNRVNENEDECAVCGKTGKLLCCDSCPRAYHHRCVDPPLSSKESIEDDWYCSSCKSDGVGKENRFEQSKERAQVINSEQATPTR